MTAYSASTTVSFSANAGTVASSMTFSLSPVSFEIKILSLQYGMTQPGSTGNQFAPSANCNPVVYRYVSGTASGGSAVTPIVFRQGGAAPTATSRAGTGVSVTGTQTYLTNIPSIGTSHSLGADFTFAADLTISPGSVLAITTGGIGLGGGSGDTISGIIRMSIYFEELRLSWPY